MTIELSQNSPDPKIVELFEVRDWMFVPIERVTEPPNPPAVPYRGMVMISGLVRIDFQGDSVTDWRYETYQLDLNHDLGRAINDTPYTPQPGNAFVFHTERWATFATISSRYNAGLANNDGTAVERWRLDWTNNAVLEVDLAVRDDDAHIYRLAYKLNLQGWLEEGRTP
jgi:hypothetical protein